MQNQGRTIDVAMQTNPGIIEEYQQLNKTITNEKDQMEKKLEEYAKVNTSREYIMLSHMLKKIWLENGWAP